VALLFCPYRCAVASGLRDDVLDSFRVDVRGIVADVDGVVLPIQPNLSDVWLLS
jgi:hypothetical protein